MISLSGFFTFFWRSPDVRIEMDQRYSLKDLIFTNFFSSYLFTAGGFTETNAAANDEGVELAKSAVTKEVCAISPCS